MSAWKLSRYDLLVCGSTFFCPTPFGVGQNAQGGGIRCPGGVGQNAHIQIVYEVRGAKRPCGAKSPSWGKRLMGVLPHFAYFLVEMMI